jgi:hypothetical protein
VPPKIELGRTKEATESAGLKKEGERKIPTDVPSGRKRYWECAGVGVLG